ncbi:hypothetical protein GCM10022393_11110 [Aquimarina addita]|uniref:DUF4907 domain-containing protein n=1 Tax=Aquimarina addita TaxID=870485 RepID=A0ABP7XEL3_9FLAO
MRMKMNYVLIFGIITFGVLFGTCFVSMGPGSDPYSKYYSLEVKELSDHYGWYYEIYIDDTLLIKQKNIPGAYGYQFFKSKKDAKKIALLVVDKLVQEITPTITKAELDSCNIDFVK